MNRNIIGNSDITVVNEKIDNLSTAFKQGYEAVKSFDIDGIKVDYNIQFCQVDLMHAVSDEVDKSIENIEGYMRVVSGASKICDSICELYYSKIEAIQSEYEHATRERDGRLMTICYQEIETCNNHRKCYRSHLKELLVKYENCKIVYDKLYAIRNELSVYGVLIFDALKMNKEELVNKIYELRLLNMNSHNELVDGAIEMCKKRLAELGYVWENPYINVSKEKLALEKTKAFNQYSNLIECSNTITNEIINLRISLAKTEDGGILEKRISELEICNKYVMMALLLAEDKYNAIKEVLNE